MTLMIHLIPGLFGFKTIERMVEDPWTPPTSLFNSTIGQVAKASRIIIECPDCGFDVIVIATPGKPIDDRGCAWCDSWEAGERR